MKKIKSFILIFVALIALVSCSTIKEGFTNTKKTGADEFLVQKKQPLTMPPNYDKLPLPNTNIDAEFENKQKDLSLEKILKNSSNELKTKNKKEKSSSIESLILKKIKK